ncbi:MAG TPA: chaperone modulator CbpM [Noviherbaspirillum sp.]|uniref:chaperone modulator CbpM n=1 Tax=Noviherbaspirillum sp. TaxID=1926288 RepID=UPI002B46C7FF|nr:chaperone modulator CbpM [Noviherbaspirillum sp.]HJV85136.1 chaperone modulator CbpM [Noviherbaspirillum sp.]
MQIEDAIAPEESGICTIEHLAKASGLSLAEVQELIDTGVIVPLDQLVEPARFHKQYVVTALTARRLRDDFELDRRGVAVALMLLQRIDALENELRALKARH